MLLFSVPGTQLSFRARLLPADNPSVVDLVLKHLPLNSVLCHVVVSGETFYIPSRILFFGSGNMVKRQRGTVYFHAPGHTICVCYGNATESAEVNQFGQVLQDDLEKLPAIGELVYQQTVQNETPTIVRVEVRLIGGDGLVKEVDPPLPVSAAHWRVVKAHIEKEIDEMWFEEPDEVRKIRLGVIESGAGSGGQSFSVLVHLKAFLMLDGSNIVYRMLQLAHRTTLTTDDIKEITHVFLTKTFNHFEFYNDLGLPSLLRVGSEYCKALDTVTNKAEYVELTGALLVYVTHMHRWIHFIFPWHLGGGFPHRAPAEIAGFSRLLTYSEEAN